MHICLSDVKDEKQLRRIASHQLERLKAGIASTSEQMVKTSGWLTAALFALNGGGVLAVVNSIEKLDQPAWSAGLFVSGVMLALINAVLVQHFTSASASKAENLLLFWKEVEATGMVHANYEELVRPLLQSQRFSWLAPLAGWASGSLFFIGCVVLGIDVSTPSRELTLQCTTLQKDMVKRTPTHQNSRELFTALRCTPR